ncbi:MAG: Phosphatidylserine decarboxylase [Myxococcaceae bacterium]|nr:Phosphatidylserine decarboxylase [Myxococcaceae bacterium]
MGRIADISGPTLLVQSMIRSFVRIYDVDLSEAIVPANGFESFDAFFTRALKPDARAIDESADTVVSPADGRIEDFGVIESHSRFLVKGHEYEVGELLGAPEEAESFRGGTFFIVYLSPRDYHRVHAPVDGRVQRARHVDGTLWPVNSIGLDHVPRLFAKNERVTTMQSSRFGTVATVMVGAIGVGRISMSFDARITTNRGRPAGLLDYQERGPTISRGGELGRFHLGSTAIVLLGPQHRFKFAVEAGKHVQMGQVVARRLS